MIKSPYNKLKSFVKGKIIAGYASVVSAVEDWINDSPLVERAIEEAKEVGIAKFFAMVITCIAMCVGSFVALCALEALR